MITTYNIASTFCIALVIAFGFWVAKQTKQVQQQTELIKARRQRVNRKNRR
jgi:hypothetical protein